MRGNEILVFMKVLITKYPDIIKTRLTYII